MVDGTGLENQQINVSQVRILSLPPNTQVRIPHAVWDFFILSLPPVLQIHNQKKTLMGLFLASVFKTWMLAFIAMLMIIIPILFRNRF